MRRLRLRKIWVVLAVMLLMVPLLKGRMGEAVATSTTATTAANPSSSYEIKFIKVEDGVEVPDDGTSMPRFDLKPVNNSETGFATPNGARLKMEIWVNGQKATDIGTTYEPKWTITVNSVDVTDTSAAVDLGGMTVIPFDESGWDKAMREYDISPRAGGLLVFNVHVDLMYDSNKNGVIDAGDISTPIDRQAVITVPLQILNKNTLGSYFKYAYAEQGDDVKLWVNNISTSQMYWYYYDFTTDEYVKLEDPDEVNTEDAKLVTGKLGLVSGLKSGAEDLLAGRPQQTANDDIKVYEYTAKANDTYAGISRIVGRIYLNNDNRQEIFIEQTFDILIDADVKNNDWIDASHTVNIEYGQKVSFSSISNDKGNSLEWYLYGVDSATGGESELTDSTEQPTAVELVSGTGAIGRYYGTDKVGLTPVPMYHSWINNNVDKSANDLLKDYVIFNTKFSVLKGEVEGYKERATEYEVVDIKGNITLSTNIKAKDGYQYHWYWLDGSGAQRDFQTDANEYVDVSGIVSFNGEWSGMKLTGKKAGTVKIRCIASGNDATPAKCTQEITLKVIDSLILSESRRSVVKGDSFTLKAETSDLAGTVTWTSANPDYVTVDPTGRTVTVTGVEITGEKYIDITATHVPSGRTATCKVRVVEPLSAVTIEGDKVIGVDNRGELWLDFAGADPGYTKDQLRWILKDKDGVEAESVLTLTEYDDTSKAWIQGVSVGEAYVAVVLTEVRGESKVETELAVATIRVVSPAKGLIIEEGPSIVDYLENGSITLHATILPNEYVDTDNVTVEWYLRDPQDLEIVTITPSAEDSKSATVTYKKVGKVLITASVKGMTNVADQCDIDIQNPVKEIILDPEVITMKEGDTAQIKATVVPDDATDKSLVWTSDDPSIASVDEYGLVTAEKAGVTFITATASNGVTKRCQVIVQVAAERIELNYYDITVRKGTVFYLSAKVLPEDTYDKSVTFTSADDKIATVDPDGTVTAVGVGVVEITVTSNDNPDIEPAVCVVTVTEAVAGITLNAREITIDVGEQYLLKATVRPSDAVNKAVTFESADPSIATVDEKGLITGVKGGTTVVFVTTEERGLTASCTVTVQEDITSITMIEDETYVGKGKDKKIKVTILPASATKKKLLWTSSDESIVIVDQEGNIHGVNVGTAIVTATAQDDGKVSATCKVTVVDEMTEIILNQSVIRIMQNDTYQLTYTVKPDYATVKRVSWSTSDASVARVDSLGLVRAVGEGEAKIRATATDGSGVYAECTVIVTPMIPATSVRINTTATTMLVGDSRTLTARMLPRNTSEGLRWVSDDTSVITIDNNGNAVAVGPGVCQVTAISSVSGLEGTCTITVLGLNASTITLEQYDTFDLYLDGVESGVTWFSKNKRVATVSRRGIVTARKEGTTDVVARVNGKMVTCAITVEKLKK